jgi:hypothetical protein
MHQLQPWTRFLLLRVAAGAGFAVVLSVIIGVVMLFKSHSSSPTPWNTQAISATFDSVATEGADHTLVFYYILENRTSHDYQLPDPFDVTVMAKLKEGSLSLDNGAYKGDQDLFLPANERARFGIHSALRVSDPGGAPPADGALDGSVNTLAPSLNGFVVFDQKNRYEIVMPKGWPANTASLTH